VEATVRALLLLLAIGLAAGAGTGFALRPSPAGSPPAPVGVDPLAGGSAPHPNESPPESPAIVPTAPAPEPESPRESPERSGTISGRITDSVRRAFPGVTVRLRPVAIEWPGEDSDLEAWHADLVRDTRETTSDADGMYAFDELPLAARFEVSVDHPSWRWMGAHRPIVTTGEIADFTAPDENNPFLFPITPQVARRFTGNGCPIDASPRPYAPSSRPLVRGAGAPLRFFAHDVLASAWLEGDRLGDREVELVPCPALHGVFRTERSSLRYRPSEGEPVEIPIDAETGRFAVVGLEPGAWTFEVCDANGTVLSEFRHEGVEGYQRVLWQDENEIAADFTVDVVGADGNPASEGLQFSLAIEWREARGGGGNRSSSIFPVSAGDGRYWFSVPEDLRAFAESGVETTPSLHISANFADAKVLLDPGFSGHYRVEIPALATLRTEIPGYIGSGFEGDLSVSLSHPKGQIPFDLDFFEQTLLDENGRGEVRNVMSGAYDLRASLLIEGSPFEYHHESLELTGSDLHRTIPLPLRHSLAVRFGPEWHGKRVSLSRPGNGGTISVESCPEVLALDLPSGSYTIRCRSARVEVEVQGDTAIDFRPPHYLALRVDQVPENSPFRIGDVIVALDGVEISHPEPYLWLHQTTQERGEVLLTIVREGIVQALPVRGSDLVWRRKDGLRLAQLLERP